MIRILVIGALGDSISHRLRSYLGGSAAIEFARGPAAGIRELDATPPDAIIIADDVGSPRVEAVVAAIRQRPVGQLMPLVLVCPLPQDMPVAQKVRALGISGWLSTEASAVEMVDVLARELDVPSSTLLRGPRPEDAGPAMAPAPQGHVGPRTQPMGAISGARAPSQTPAGYGAPPAAPAPHSYAPVPPAYEPPGHAGQSPYASHSALHPGALHPATSPTPGYTDAGHPHDYAPGYVDEADQTYYRDRRTLFPARDARTSEAQGVDVEAIVRKLRAVRHEDYYAMLEIPRGAEGQTVREAFHRLYTRFDPSQVDFQVAYRYEAELGEIRDALEDAWAVLGDGDVREKYLVHTLRK